MTHELESPNIKVYCDGTIARIVFAYDAQRIPQWFYVDELFGIDHIKFDLSTIPEGSLRDLLDVRVIRRLPIEEWLATQEMKCVEDDMVLFKLTWR